MPAAAEVGRANGSAYVELGDGTRFAAPPSAAQDGQPISDAIVRLARARGWPVTGLYVERGRLDDVFRTITVPERAPQPDRAAA